MVNKKPKEPLLAVIFSLIFIGIGQIYSGRLKRGLLFIGLYTLGGIIGFAIFYHYFVKSHTSISAASLGIMIVLAVSFWIFGLFTVFDAYRCAKTYNTTHNLQRKITAGKKTVLISGIIIVLFIPGPGRPLATHIRNNFFQTFKFSSGSMKPTIWEGDRLLADKKIYKHSKPQRGDLIVFHYPEDPSRDFLKRLIASGGESVEIKEGDVYINGEFVDDPRIKNIFYYNRGEYGKQGQVVEVPDGHYYVLGDNSASSRDSRFWGFVPQENIIGKIHKIYWPPNRSGPVE